MIILVLCYDISAKKILILGATGFVVYLMRVLVYCVDDSIQNQKLTCKRFIVSNFLRVDGASEVALYSLFFVPSEVALHWLCYQ